MTELLAKIDSKGRIVIPDGLRENLGEAVVVTRTEKGILIRPTKERRESLERLLDSRPRRRGKPENPKPHEMKSIWNE